MDDAGEGPVTVAGEIGLERNHLSDFFQGRKNSLKTETMIALGDRYNIPIKDLVVTKEKPARATG